MDTIKISSQRYIDADIVQAKRANRDYEVTLGKVIMIDDVAYQVVVDGHHSLAAAIADGVSPDYTLATAQDNDRECIDDVDQYLEAHWMDSNYYDVATGVDVF